MHYIITGNGGGGGGGIMPGDPLVMLSSGAATVGQVPVADGAGGINWRDPILPEAFTVVVPVQTIFNTVATTLTGHCWVWLQGQLLYETTDYTVTGANQITLNNPPAAVLNDVVLIAVW